MGSSSSFPVLSCPYLSLPVLKRRTGRGAVKLQGTKGGGGRGKSKGRTSVLKVGQLKRKKVRRSIRCCRSEGPVEEKVCDICFCLSHLFFFQGPPKVGK